MAQSSQERQHCICIVVVVGVVIVTVLGREVVVVVVAIIEIDSKWHGSSALSYNALPLGRLLLSLSYNALPLGTLSTKGGGKGHRAEMGLEKSNIERSKQRKDRVLYAPNSRSLGSRM